MRIPRYWVTSMAIRIITHLIQCKYIDSAVSEKALFTATEEILLEELMVEDRLNEEVRRLLNSHMSEIESRRLDYKKLFDLTKKKLTRERNLVL